MKAVTPIAHISKIIKRINIIFVFFSIIITKLRIS
jgi:hypothetical protein